MSDEVRGIDVSVIEDTGSKSGKVEGTFSGRELTFFYSDTKLSIRDKEQPSIGFDAEMVDKSMMSISVKTKLSEKNNQKHDDFYAGDLFSFALRFFQKRGFEVSLLKTDWKNIPGMRDNWLAFTNRLPDNPTRDDLSQACWQTWTGKQAKKHDFKSIREIKHNPSRSEYEAIFSKKENESTVVAIKFPDRLQAMSKFSL